MKSMITVLLFLLAFLGGRESFAASYDVQITQVDPPGETYAVSCTDERDCVAQMILRTRTPRKEPVAAHISFKEGGKVTFKFQNFRGYLYAGSKGDAKSTELAGLVGEDGRLQTSLTLYFLAAPVRYKSSQLAVLHGEYAAIGDLEITISPAQ